MTKHRLVLETTEERKAALAAQLDLQGESFSGWIEEHVRRHINWDKLQVELTESLAHLVCHIMQRTCGVASAGFRLSFV